MDNFSCNLWAHILGGIHSFSGWAAIIFAVIFILGCFVYNSTNIEPEEKKSINKTTNWFFGLFMLSLFYWFTMPTSEVVKSWCGG